MQFLPVMNLITRFVLPIFFEGISMVLATAICRSFNKKKKSDILIQVLGIIVISVSISLVIKQRNPPGELDTGLLCAIIQGGYSANDYNIIEAYPALGNELVRRYLQHIEASPSARIIVVPESAFPIYQSENGVIVQQIKDIARTRKVYIMSSILLEEETAIYNAVVLINPTGQYRRYLPEAECDVFCRK
jgi:apolipoprotein N-acyltransferase